MTFELISVEEAPLMVQFDIIAIAAWKRAAPLAFEATETSVRETGQRRKKKRRD